MKIRELNLINYRGFEGERRFEFADRFTVIAGINGRGKTAVLDATAIILYRFLRALELSSGGQRTIAAEDVFANQETVSIAMKANCGGIPIKFSASRDQSTRRVRASGLSRAVRDEVLKIYGDPTRPDDQAPLAVYYTTDRAGYRIPRSLPARVSELKQAAYAGALVNRMVDYRDFMARWRVWTVQSDKRVRHAFHRALGDFLEDFGELEVESKPPRLTIRKGKHRLSISQLSDGERSFVAVLADLVRRLSLANPELDDPLLGHGVVLIDEIELHLHPQWQRTVVETLRKTFPNIQFVATTHSPFILQTLRDGELISLDPEGEGSYANRGIEEITVSVMGIESPQITPRYLEMLDAAKDYFVALEKAETTKPQVRSALRRRLNKLSRKYADNPAYQAFLELQLAKTQND